MSVVPYERPRDWIALMAPAVELAKAVANTDFVKRTMRGNPAAITAAILYGDEVGLEPMQSLAKIDVIEGKPSLAAEAQRALILAAGHEIWVEESSSTRCTIAGRRRDSEHTSRVTWTLDDARRAKLEGKPTWRAYPRQMLLARASAELARAVFPDAIGGLAATEELLEGGGLELEAGEPAPVAELEQKRTRSRRRPSATVSAGAPAPPEAPEREPAPIVDRAPPEPEPAPATDAGDAVRVISETDRRFLHARKHELGLDDETLKDVIEELTGQRSTTKVPAEQLGELLNAMAQRQLADAAAEAERLEAERLEAGQAQIPVDEPEPEPAPAE